MKIKIKFFGKIYSYKNRQWHEDYAYFIIWATWEVPCPIKEATNRVKGYLSKWDKIMLDETKGLVSKMCKQFMKLNTRKTKKPIKKVAEHLNRLFSFFSKEDTYITNHMKRCSTTLSVQFSLSVVSNCLWPHGLQLARLLCPSPIPEAYSNSCPLSKWCRPTISSCHPILLPPSTSPSIRVFSSEAVLHISWSKYWSFSLSINPSNEYSGLISFKIDRLDLIAVQGTLKCLLQHNSSKATIFLCSAFFIVQLSYPYMTTGKNISLTKQTFMGKIMSLLFNMLSRLNIAFLPRSKYLLISWLQSPSAVILEPPKIKSATVSFVSPSIFHGVLGPDAMILVFLTLSFKPIFSLSYFTVIKRLFSSSSLSAIRVCHLLIWGYWCFSQQTWFQLVLHPAQNFSWCTLHIS